MSQINTNTYSLNAQKNLAKNSIGLASAMERLSSGLRVNSAKDDASGLASGVQIAAAARVTAVNIRLESDKISAAQIADGALAAASRIMDAEFAQETSNLSRFQILQQAGTAMVAQANAVPQNVLSLLR
jgi:flagellin